MLCVTCKNKAFIRNLGKCKANTHVKECEGYTESGAYKYSYSCSKALAYCMACGDVILAKDVS